MCFQIFAFWLILHIVLDTGFDKFVCFKNDVKL